MPSGVVRLVELKKQGYAYIRPYYLLCGAVM